MSRIKVKQVRVGFPVFWTPRGFKGEDGKEGTPKFSGTFYLHKKKHAADIKAVKAEMAAAHAASSIAKTKINAEKMALREVPEDKIDETGNISGTDMKAEDYMILTASNSKAPPIVNKNPAQKIEEKDDIIYGGCYVNVSVSFWVQNNKYGKRINGSLESVQFFGDGDRFGRAPVNAEDEFENIEEEENDDPSA